MTNDNKENGIEAKVSRGFIKRAAEMAAPKHFEHATKPLMDAILLTGLAATVANAEFTMTIKVKAKDGIVEEVLGEYGQAVDFLAQLSEQEIIEGISRTLVKKCQDCKCGKPDINDLLANIGRGLGIHEDAIPDFEPPAAPDFPHGEKELKAN